ncbi:PEP-CTERM system histidine kinase PrsK [Allosphingosinicella flava]|uniref:histidine kinase n=1 Tax=Allosphingosinicella flava TaxID=2771430 RepID=A0A7T2GJ25_9SPHN|nr:XrtA/PEP-CTERM system histidine kinase PrsK [Sphingosinicella flava]QPQ54794.1 PEP-CTERM system histidine kinase PrsK [Sphingosinicella flava]
MIGMIGLWSDMIAACLYGGLALWQLRHWSADTRSHPLTAAFAIIAAWMAFKASEGADHLLPGLAEPARNVAFLAFMHAIAMGREQAPLRALGTVYGAVAAVVGCQILTVCLLHSIRATGVAHDAAEAAYQVLGLTVSAGALILVHNLYSQAQAGSRAAIRLPMLGLAAMWTYDLHLYTVAYLTRDMPTDLVALRGAMLALLAPFFAAAGRKESWSVELSRTATFQSLSLLAIFGYLILMMSATRALEAVKAGWVGMAQAVILLLMASTLLILLPSRRIRAWMRVTTAKHFFPHRYDYRAEWLRFTRTIGTSGPDALPIDVRVVKALAQAADASGGMMLTLDGDYRFAPAGQWNWRMDAQGWQDATLGRLLEERAFIIDFGTVDADGKFSFGGSNFALPRWTVEAGSWAGVPVIHNDRLVALVLLAAPPVRRPIDWEDFDLFRTAGIEAASYLAEAQAQEKLADARRFDEFNRRFAFIMHDIKNLVSQISLVARNAERHANNPEFRADMIATLQSSVRKMNDLLARLSKGAQDDIRPSRPVEVRLMLAPLVEARRRIHPIELSGDAGIAVQADGAGFEQAVTHLLQNAIDASTGGQPIRIAIAQAGALVTVAIADQGCGMSAEFIRTRLFQPFASTKEGGFGIGAYEARSLIEAMGGRLDVDSREGMGTTFTITLPAADIAAVLEEERIRA